MSDKAVEVIAEAMREQGAVYPNAGAILIFDALKAAGIALVELPDTSYQSREVRCDSCW